MFRHIEIENVRKRPEMLRNESKDAKLKIKIRNMMS
jgi:hypothetical protein